MTEAEKILRGKITEIRAWDNEPLKSVDNVLNHAIIPYKDALKAVEEALSDSHAKDLTNFSDWDLSGVNNHAVKEDATIKAKPKSRSKTIGFSEWVQMVDVNKYLNAKDVDCSKFFESFKSYQKDAIIKEKPKPIRLIDKDIDRKQCTVLRFKVKGGGKIDDWWVFELVCSYENIFIHYRVDERSLSNIDFQPYFLTKREAYTIINEWKNELG